jgi:hypothetical protein
MKKVLILFIFCFLGLSANATEYYCKYRENNIYYDDTYILNETADEHCKRWCDNDFRENVFCVGCLNRDYPRILRAFRSGKCKKIMPLITYNNFEGCQCIVRKLEDGTIYMHGCAGPSSSCNVKKATAKFKLMLTK